MPYGTIKIDTITFTDGGVDKSVPVSGLVQNPTFTGNITATGTISGNIIQGGTTVSGLTVTGTTANFASGVFTTQVSGVTVIATTGTFTSLTGTTTNGTTASFTTGTFTSLTGTTTTGTTANFASGVFTTQVSGVTVIATTGTFTSLTGTTTNGTTASFTTGNFTSLTGTTTTGTTANFASGVFTTQISGVTVIATTGTFTSLTGTTTTMTSGVFASGTEPLPSISFVSDPNTGIYSPGADQLAVATNGTEKLIVLSNGNVGIGTSSPGQKLDVNGEIVCSPNTAGRNTFQFTTNAADDASLLMKSNTTTKVHIQANGTSYFNGGNVGIGTTNPSQLLDIVGATSGTVKIDGLTRGGVASFYLNGTQTSIVGNTGAILGDSTAGLGLLAETGNEIRLYTNGSATPRVIVDTSGRLLVGTSTARANFFNSTVSAALQVEGTGNDTSSLSITRNSADVGRAILTLAKTRGGSVGSTTIVQSEDALGSVEFQGSDGTEFVQAAAIQCEVDGTPGANDMPGRLVFSTNPGSPATSPTERMRIKANGDVSIVTGNLIIGTAGKGIDFSADGQAAGMTSELLDDYEEGTWTPAQGAGLTVVGAFSSIGRYTKIGNLVTVYGQLTGATSIAVSAVSQMTDNLPFQHNGEMGSTGIATGISSAAAAASFISTGGPLAVLSLQAISGVTALSFTNTYRVV